MKITQIEYQHLRNLGNFENARLQLTAELVEGDDVAGCVVLLRRQVLDLLYNQPSPAQERGPSWVYQDDDGGTIPPS